MLTGVASIAPRPDGARLLVLPKAAKCAVLRPFGRRPAPTPTAYTLQSTAAFLVLPMHLRHLTGLLLISSLAALPVTALQAQETLRILTWPGYADSDLVEEFAKRHDVKVEVTLIDTDEVLRAKMNRNQGGDYDVLAANTAEMQYYIDQQLVQPLQLADIPNTKRQLWRFRNLQSIPGISRDGNIYAVPYTYAEMGL